VASVSPLTPTISSTGSTSVPGSTYSSAPQTETSTITTDASNPVWSPLGNLKSAGTDSITLFATAGSNNHIGRTLNLTNFNGISVPAGATVTSITAQIRIAQTGGTSSVYLNSIQLLGTSSTSQSVGPGIPSGGITATFTGLSLTPAQANSTALGLSFYPLCTQSPGNGATITVSGVTLTVNYTVPVYTNFVVTLSKPVSPQQQGTGTGNTIAASAVITNGVTVIGVTPNIQNGWLTGWTIAAQYPTGSGTLTSSLSMSVTGSLTYLSGNVFVTNNVTYISDAAPIATIVATYGGGGGGGSTLTITTASLPNGTIGLPYNQTLVATGGTTPYSWSTTSTLPTGMSLSTTGVLHGVPTSAYSQAPLFVVKDSSTPQQSASKNIALTVPV
jgi:hypothetical protein